MRDHYQSLNHSKGSELGMCSPQQGQVFMDYAEGNRRKSREVNG